MKKLVIMQPTYLPWAGYFNLISQADNFVFLDDVKVEKQSWQVRNKVLNIDSEHLLSLPISGSRNQLLNEVVLGGKQLWQNKHSKLLTHLYAKHAYGLEILDTLLPIINDKKTTSLVKLNTDIIFSISESLGFNPTFHFSSQLNTQASRSKRLVSICHQLGCEEYLSPIGSKDYIEKDGDFAASTLKLTYQNFLPPPYPQKGNTNFIPYLSIIDMIANIGWQNTAALIK